MCTILLSYSSSFYFGIDWQRVLDASAIEEFHATDFYRRAGVFKGWSQTQCNTVERDLIDLFLRWEVKHSAICISTDAYQRSFVETRFHKRIRPVVRKWKQPYLVAFQTTVLNLREYSDHQPTGCFISPVFDRCQEFMAQAREFYDQRNHDGKLARMQQPTERNQFVQLQAADFLAWHYRKRAQDHLSTGSKDLGPVLGALEEHMFGAKMWTFDALDYLRKRVEAVNAGNDPDMVPIPSSLERHS